MGGSEGNQVENVVSDRSRQEAMLEAQSGFGQNQAVQQALSAYSSGSMGLEDALAQAKGSYKSGLDIGSTMPDFGRQYDDQGRGGGHDMGAAGRAGVGGALGGAPGAAIGAISSLFGGESKEDWVKEQEDKWRKSNKSRYKGMDDVGFNDTLFRQMASTTPGGASRFAEDQIGKELANSPGLSGMFGEGGSFSKAQDEEARLRDQGFQLTPEDREAYGQVSGDITRQFGQQGQNLSQMLAERGLSGAPSGAAGSGFSGLAGNKFEQLAKAQTNIAQQRMQTTMQRLNSNRSYMNSLMNSEMEMRESARNRIFNQSMQGRQQGMQETQIGANQQLAARGMEQNQLNTGFEQQQATKSPGIGSALGGLVGAGVGSLAGGLGTGIGASVGKNLFGGDS